MCNLVASARLAISPIDIGRLLLIMRDLPNAGDPIPSVLCSFRWPSVRNLAEHVRLWHTRLYDPVDDETEGKFFCTRCAGKKKRHRKSESFTPKNTVATIVVSLGTLKYIRLS